MRSGLDAYARWLPLGVFAIGLGLAGLAAYEVETRVQDQALAEFRLETERAETLLNLQTGQTEQLLRGAAAFLSANPDATAATYRAFVDSLNLDRHFPGVRALAYARGVTRAERAVLAAELAADPSRAKLGYPPFEIWPEAGRDRAFPAVLVEPDAGNARVYGYDLWSDPERRAAARLAIETGRLQASAPVVLSQDAAGERVSQLLVMPVYDRRAANGEGGTQPAPHIGFAASGVSVDAMLATTPGAALFRRTGLTIYDAGRGAGQGGAATLERAELLYRVGNGAVEGGRTIAIADYDRLTQVSFAGRRWLLGFDGLANFRTPLQQGLTYAASAGTAAIAGLLALLLHCLLGERRRLRAEVAAHSAELKRVNAELRHRLEEVHEANHAKSQFLASVSHELRTPLNAILGFSEMLQAGVFGAVTGKKNREYVDDIHAAGQRLLTQVNQLLDLSRIEAGEQELRQVPVDLAEAMARCRQLVQHVGAGGGPARVVTPVHVRADRDLPAVLGDPEAIDQVLLNLVGNAIKFSPPASPVELTAARESDGSVVVAVRDHGPGISESHLERLTEPFFQVADQHSRATEGTGLGLSIVERLVRAHGAWLEVDSELGVGTRMAIHFPRERVQAAETLVRQGAVG
jgi:signal transduction histidine kinase